MTRQPTPNVLDAVLGPVDAELSPLTTWEGGRLAHLEGIIEAGLQTFYDVGGALMEIREGRLYRQTHRSFEAYTKERWGMGKSRAHQLIEAASTVAAISGPVVEGEPSTIVDTLPVNESQVRALSGLDDQAKREVWAEAVATAPAGKVTGRHVEVIIRRRQMALTEEQIGEFLAYYWRGADLQAVADCHDPRGVLRGLVVRDRAGGAGGRWRYQSISGKVECWDGGDYFSRPADAVWTYDQFARLSLAILPQPARVEPSPKPSTIVDTLPGRDGRIERAQRLIDQCRAITGRAFEDEYTALIGRPSDLLAVNRALDGIVAKLEHLQRTLMGEQETQTWGEL